MARRFSLERVPLGWRLAVLVAAPLLVIAVVAGARLTSLAAARADGRTFQQQIEQTALIDRAIGRIQDERELTARFLGSPLGGAVPATLEIDLERARTATDAALAEAELATVLPPFDLASLPALTAGGALPASGLMDLEDLRLVVDRRLVPPADIVLIYSTVIYGYLDSVAEVVGSNDRSAPSGLLAYTASLASEEAFVQARAWGSVILAAPDSTPREWILLSSLAQTEEFFLGQARSSAQHPAELDRLIGTPQSRNASQLRWDVIAGGNGNGAVTQLRWQQETQARADALDEAGAHVLDDLIEHADLAVRDAEMELLLIGAFALVVIGLVAAGAWCVSRSIARPLERLAVGARAASTGDLSAVELPDSRDAIGEIGRAYGLLDQYLHHVADSAEEIARGDLARKIKPRSARDRLGTALQSMTSQLSSMVVHSRQRSAALEETVGVLQETAARDPLTGLLNRGRFVELADVAVESAAATNSRFGLLFMDLDGFKPVNDEFGHAAGDELLRQVSSRLLGVLRVDDAVARLGGDEFTVLITNGFDAIAVEAVAQQIIDLVGSPYFVQGETVEVRASLGLARYPEHGETVEVLLAAADQAMYRAKRAGGNVVRVAASDRAA